MKKAVQLVAIGVASVVLSGCAAKVVSTSARSVVISAGDARVQEAQDLADKECAKYSRHARLTARPSRTSDQFVYDCVE